MSFMLTTEQIRNRTKTVTRRLGWRTLKAGDRIAACRKCMGLKKGEKIEKLAELRVVSVLREPLSCIFARRSDCAAEGFPEMTPAQFVIFFRKSHRSCANDSIVTRIEFEYCEAEAP